MNDREEIIVKKFDAYLKRTFQNELKRYYSNISKRNKIVVNFSSLSKMEEGQLKHYDTYAVETFCEKISTRFFDAAIHDELLYEALLSLAPIRREILLLKYWGMLTDSAVGELLSMSQQTINYNKNKSLQDLRKIMEEMGNCDKRSNV